MKFKKAFGIASLAATLSTTGILGGFASTVGAQDTIPMYRPGQKIEDIDVAFTKSLAAPSDIDPNEIPSLYYNFEMTERASEDVYVAGEPVEMYQVAGKNFANMDTAKAALAVELSKDVSELTDTEIEEGIKKITANFDKTKTGSLTGTKNLEVFIDPANSKTYAEDATAGRQGDTLTQKKVDGDVTYYRHETGNFLEGLTFNAAGVYAYDVVETQTAYKKANKTDAWTNVETEPNPNPNADGSWVEQKIVMSQQRYRLYIYTEEDPANQGEYLIWAMTAVEVDKTDGNIVKGEKKDMTVGGNANIDGDLSNVEFNNAYKKVNHSGKNPQVAGYGVQKRVEGVKNAKGTYIEGGANTPYNDESILFGKNGVPAEQFDFDVTITRNSLYAEDTSYIGYVVASTTGGTSWQYVKSDGTLAPMGTVPAVDGSDKGQYKYYEFEFTDTKNADTKKVTLSHYQKLAFADIPVGTGYSVAEDDYREGGKLYGDAEKFTPDDPENKLKFIKTSVNGVDVTETGRLTEGSVPTDPFTSEYINNAKQGTSPTGIITNILPFIVIIGGAAVALAVAVVVKGKKRGNEAQ